MIFQKKNLALLVFFLTFHSFLDAQTSQSINGLSSNFIESVKSDEFGIIWIGTNEGLNALIDGRVYQYQSDLSDPASLLNTQINDIYVTDNNTVIALSNEGQIFFKDQITHLNKYVQKQDQYLCTKTLIQIIFI